jgi:hypothetical protein
MCVCAMVWYVHCVCACVMVCVCVCVCVLGCVRARMCALLDDSGRVLGGDSRRTHHKA